MNIYAFADEACGLIDGQIAALRRNGLQGLEIRGVDGQNIADITIEKAREVRRKLDDNGLTVWSMGSPIGKIGIVDGDFPAHLEKLRHVLALADVLGAKNLRMFSFYMPGNDIAPWRQKVIDQMGQMIEAAQGTGVTLCHENEKGIYGDVAPRCRELLDIFPALANIFDPANYIQSGQDTLEGWKLLADRTRYLHIKDALADGHVVPAGKGIGHVKAILDDFRARGGSAVTIEPHLTVFAGLKDLERAGEETKIDPFSYESSDAAFDAACDALKALL
ncbi:MAG: sugar phosphate isomerase/epimerase [Clostridia bacterium]|nr:sugar phosphate isomerase/epimerase [Clostridia bacterium]